MSESAVDVHAAIVNTGNKELTTICLNSLPEACRSITWRVSVFDNASTDGSDELLRRDFPDVQVVSSRIRLGATASRNRLLTPIVQRGTARYVLVLDEDIELQPTAVAELVKYGDHSTRVGAVGPVVIDRHGVVQPSFAPFPTFSSQLLASVLPGRSRPIAHGQAGWLQSCCVLYRVDALRETGLFDENLFWFFDDTDLGLRLHDAGWPSEVCRAAAVVHVGHGATGRPDLAEQMERQMVRSAYLYFEKHRGRGVAGAIGLWMRLAFMLRALKAAAEAVGGGETDRRHARSLLRLARYDARHALGHERDAKHSQ
jgi:N-acetylglucosaminyl-diphospho-decaprenol L-rhamnosyltransferase